MVLSLPMGTGGRPWKPRKTGVISASTCPKSETGAELDRQVTTSTRLRESTSILPLGRSLNPRRISSLPLRRWRVLVRLVLRLGLLGQVVRVAEQRLERPERLEISV